MQERKMNGFILNIPPDQVVDRDKYIDEITPIIKNSSKSNVIILMAESAIGKSSLVDKLLDNVSLKQDKIRVKTLPLNNSEKNEEWEFLISIFNETYQKYINTPDSFEAYIYSLKNKFTNRELLHYIVTTLYQEDAFEDKKKFYHSFLFLSIMWFFKLGKFNIENIIHDNSIKGNRIKAQYIKNIILHHKIILAVDNIQNIDRHSLREFINIINETKSNCPQFIFEYTLTDRTSKSECQKLGESFNTTSIETKIIPLEKIDSKYIVDVVSRHMLIPNTNWEFNVKLQKEYDRNNNGNIREMIDFGICYDEAKQQYSNVEQQYSLENILKLPDYSKQLLSMIICANNSIRLEVLEQIGTKIELNIEVSLQCLLERLLIEKKENLIILSHASLTDVWLGNPEYFSIFDNISYNCLEDVYLKNIKNFENRRTYLYDLSWISLIQIYSKHKPESLVSLFKYIDVDYKNMISRENAWKYINRIIEVTRNNITSNYDLYVDIIRYCFESELYKEGYQIIQDVCKEISTEILILYNAMYLSALDRHQENIDYCKINIDKCAKNSFLYYNLKLISLSSYRSLHKLEECFSIHKELSCDKKFKKSKEYAFFLRLCEMYLERNKSLKYLNKSVKIFEKEYDYIQAGKSLISYSYILATQGKLKKAKIKIEKAERYLSDKRMGIHMFLVNKAAIRLYSGDYSEEVWEILNDSEITAVVSFDKLAIIVNKLVWCIENKESNRHELLIKNAIELLKEEPDRHIHGLIYYNIYYLLKKRGISCNSYYLKKAKEMAIYCKPLQARLTNKPTPETKFALKYNWHVCFLAYWTYDLI